MPRSSEELISSRKDEILNACALLYEKKGFRDITIRDIGEQTSFTRTSIYNYFQTKEEIFLGLLQREYEYWVKDLEGIAEAADAASVMKAPPVENFSEALSQSLAKRGCMLKLLSMNLYDMELNSRMDNLVSFKLVYSEAINKLRLCLQAYFPELRASDTEDFLYAFFPFLFGIYPYTKATEKQLDAMKLAGIVPPSYSIHGIVKPFAENLLRGILKGQAQAAAQL